MNEELLPIDQMHDDDLYWEILARDWNSCGVARTSDLLTVTFRRHYTSFFKGLETRDVTGRDRSDVERQFLTQLREGGWPMLQ